MLAHDQWPAFDRLLFLVYGPKIMGVLRAVAELGVADHLKDGPRTIEELAKLTDSQEQPLFRLLRTSAALRIVRQDAEGRFELTEEGESLRSDLSSSLRDLVVFSGDEMLTRPYSDLVHSVRTGAPAFEKVYGKSFYEYTESSPEAGALFDKTMTQRSWLTAVTLLRRVDLKPFKKIADLGGGWGHFLGEALTKHYPDATALLFERPSVLEQAKPLIADYGVTDRVELQAGDFFESVPKGYDAYLLNAVLNGLDDEQSARVLAKVREAIGMDKDARLFIFEKVMTPSTNEWDYSKLLDMDMLVLFGGRERTLEDWHKLTSEAGFELLTTPEKGGSPWSALECRVK
ncbi:hypothetical protein AOZ06_32165 [Kibdelosporangium phytohabitans]|uniref:Uncharacterized protein n=2 Tax=Kibdelosporangium phytohabitans TaxID=860235 RepID=A0A0N9IJD9_9PSEU|nr:hypothetical protein AOZ06_32165 [Kibdelosporangium phytohabitans]